MGLVKNIFAAIFGIIGSVLKGILGVFGIGKKSEFYLELDDAAINNSPALEAPSQPPAPSKTEAATVTKAQAEPEPEVSTPQPSPAAAPQASAPSAKPASVPSFSANYLGGTGGVAMKRRRPGPSMSPFMDLAKQVKVPSGAR